MSNYIQLKIVKLQWKVKGPFHHCKKRGGGVSAKDEPNFWDFMSLKNDDLSFGMIFNFVFMSIYVQQSLSPFQFA